MLAAMPLCLLLYQRPDTIPLGTWGGDAELRDAFEEQLARRVAPGESGDGEKPGTR
jgi:hypothetical protein